MARPETSESATATAFSRRPSDRFYAAVHWTLIVLLFLMFNHMLWARQFFPLPRGVGFRLFVFTILCINLVWWSVADRRLARYVRGERWSRLLRAGVAVIAIALLIPVLSMLVRGRVPLFIDTPTWYAGAFTLWHLGLTALLPIVAGVRIALIGCGKLIAVARARRQETDAAEPDGIDLNRRALLRTAFASVPVLALSAGTITSRVQENRFQVNRHRLPAPWLPDRLRGLTITHISDLHVGRLYRPWMLPRLVDEAAKLDSDLLIATGDIVDASNDVLPPAMEALLTIPHRYGAFACIGNHDEIDNRADFIRYVRERIPLLLNERRTLSIGGEKLTLAGVAYARDKNNGRRPGDIENVSQTLGGYDAAADGPAIVLAHHPHAWDVLRDFGVPLTLSGHTHGGQIMFTPPSSRPDMGIGNLLFRYISGWYEFGNMRLFVNRGVGNWFPVRINAPAEIVQIQLV